MVQKSLNLSRIRKRRKNREAERRRRVDKNRKIPQKYPNKLGQLGAGDRQKSVGKHCHSRNQERSRAPVLPQRKVVDNLPRLAYNAATRLERVANADMAELADAHGSAPVTSVMS